MFKNQKHLDLEGIEIMAKQVGSDVDALKTCEADPLTDAKVRADVAHGAADHGAGAAHVQRT